MKRGYTYEEAIAYVGVKRRKFDEEWRPHLQAMRQGSCLIFDVRDLDALFDKFKALQAPAGDDDQDDDQAQNPPRNGRPESKKGVQGWAVNRRGSTPKETEAGKSTSGSPVLDFASVASSVLKRQRGG